jgi:hypothetical protein
MKRFVVRGFLIASVLSIATPALAQDSSWYAGVGAGRLNADFRPYYTYYMGGTPDQFENEAHGLQVEFMAGRRLVQSDRFSVSLQGSAAFNSFSWSLSIPEEPSDLEYSMPYRFALSLVPEVRLGRVSLYADIGGGAGRVHELKASTDGRVSRYDYDEVRPTLNFGGGIKVKASGGFDVFGHIGYARYFGVEYDSFNLSGVVPGQVKVEHIIDKPRATGFTIGVLKRF